ncbi:alpha-1,2-fucosyltransferase [Polycladidibacter hongkongensis]|uniref:alpha-1,2-fucosyltransferase n=1 Tax=Polycladidibacter hongkongensis TaxID=1647556 RepID=UPI00082A5E4F|nr:alpha-1,2-fucosyltransferase [Pseudovibrio hongkongensis]
MIIMRMRGGLGNQLFQYALGRKLALRHNCPLRLDGASYTTTYDRELLLRDFAIKAQLASHEEIYQVLRPARQFDRKVRQLRRFWPPYRRRVTAEKYWHRSPEKVDVHLPGYVDGFFQQYCHASEVRKALQEEICLTKPLHPARQHLLSQIKQGSSVVLHVRRGDYLSPEVMRKFGSCSLGYYRAAINRMQQNGPDLRFFLFSDDPLWVRQAFSDLANANVVPIIGDGRDHEDLMLMAECKHAIIANSSFSWWAAFLNQNPEKQIIAPDCWFADGSMDEDKLLPPEWQRLPPR